MLQTCSKEARALGAIATQIARIIGFNTTLILHPCRSSPASRIQVTTSAQRSGPLSPEQARDDGVCCPVPGFLFLTPLGIHGVHPRPCARQVRYLAFNRRACSTKTSSCSFPAIAHPNLEAGRTLLGYVILIQGPVFLTAKVNHGGFRPDLCSPKGKNLFLCCV